ncbi:hypothetical protein Pedsa_3484 [Pseudopedobacter saltans DSM 12145]|uniref:Uncharacterized protein n=1 Tax=Pseudopedobacter saltans (strain ATCC 51119 / DSM 12145 / JCM 21818 / CCUG 39354 / LMG 10337 / NBRC 100064 / NCIMB 13643) TaxID=762903 RepID=F0SE94_PSESL|nr:hypothetical protein Pedsa_3484 [Pseudopedobacter saltans DSM 12145]
MLVRLCHPAAVQPFHVVVRVVFYSLKINYLLVLYKKPFAIHYHFLNITLAIKSTNTISSTIFYIYYKNNNNKIILLKYLHKNKSIITFVMFFNGRERVSEKKKNTVGW